jgi:hypothetical protein
MRSVIGRHYIRRAWLDRRQHRQIAAAGEWGKAVSKLQSSGSQAGAQTAGQRRKELNELVISYLYLRKTVGWIGTLLPVVLISGNVIFFSTSLPGSMSGYYYTHMRNVFVGALCALGVFLLAYAGYDEVDRWITNIAGLCAIGVAFFPTTPPACPADARTCTAPQVRHLSAGQQATGDIHLFFAAVTFIALGVMALRFAKPASTPGGQARVTRIRYGLGWARRDESQLPPKRRRNAIYRGCGVTILSCVVLAAASNLLPAPVKARWPLLFAFEAVAVFAFGISWFVKGQTLLPPLKDRPQPHLTQPGQRPLAAVSTAG